MNQTTFASSQPPAHHLGYVPLSEVTRGGVTESVHFGAVSICNARGDILYAAGNPRINTFARSALKPFQAAAFLSSSGVRKLGLTPTEIAVMCASHSGETIHADAVASILSKCDADYTVLRCGCHIPFKFSWFDKTPTSSDTWNELHHNCSGKHAGMIAAAHVGGQPMNDYLDFNHPVQVSARKAIASCTGLNDPSDLIAATDGCSAPTYALPLFSLAQGYARLALGKDVPDEASHEYKYGLEVAFNAMTSHPEMGSGTGRNDLAMMQAGGGDWVAKIGAEGVQAIGIKSLGLGIAIKVADGNMRGLHPATVSVLEQLGVMTDDERRILASWAQPSIKSAKSADVGAVKPVVALRALT